MTPEEKAKELIKKSLPLAHDWEEDNEVVAKKIALLCIKECIVTLDANIMDLQKFMKARRYWKDVEKQIHLL